MWVQGKGALLENETKENKALVQYQEEYDPDNFIGNIMSFRGGETV